MTAAPRVAFLTEAGQGVGLGHLRRCQALAAALGRCGATLRVLVAGDAGLAAGRQADSVTSFDWRREPGRTVELLAAWRPDGVVVDSYVVTTAFLAELGAMIPCVAAIDDLAARELPVSLVVNGGYGATALAYRVAPDTALLLGPTYALLDPVFAAEPPRRTSAAVGRVLVTLGGDPPTAHLEAALAAVRVAAPRAAIDLVVGAYATGALAAGERVTIHRGLDSLRALMLAADLAVTGGGMTLYECLASATPIVGVCLADNQRPNVESLSRAGLILRGDPAPGPALQRLVADPALRGAMAARGRGVVDGAGAARVAQALVHACLGVGVQRGVR